MVARAPRPPGTAATIIAAGIALGLTAGLALPARADELDGARVIFVRGSTLFEVDARGKDETEIAQLAAKVTVRALRTDAQGQVLLADLAGKWAWMPLDGTARSLADLPCADGPAQLSEDGSSVLCRSPTDANRSIVVDLPRGRGARPGKTLAVDVPPGGARIAGEGAERRVVWADAGGVWTAAPTDLRNRSRIALDAPLRGFLASPDGSHAIGVYADEIYADVKHTRPAEVLMTVQLDGQGARRKAIRDGVAVEWSHDSQWVLVQDGGSSCIMRASGGQYKCWRGYTAASLSSDGRWALVLGNRDGSRKQTARQTAKKQAKPSGRAAGKGGGRRAPPRPPPAADPSPAEPGDMPWDHIDEPSDEPEAPDAPPGDDDVSVAPPSGPLSLFRAKLEGAFTERPVLLVKIVDGAAVWVPSGRPSL